MTKFTAALSLYAKHFRRALAMSGHPDISIVFSEVLNTERLPYGILALVGAQTMRARARSQPASCRNGFISMI